MRTLQQEPSLPDQVLAGLSRAQGLSFAAFEPGNLFVDAGSMAAVSVIVVTAFIGFEAAAVFAEESPVPAGRGPVAAILLDIPGINTIIARCRIRPHQNAKRKIFITSFILGDDELIDLLADAARRLTGAVYVISGLNEDSLRRGLAKLADRGEEITQKVEAEKKRFVSLTNQGIAVRGHDNCHAKFVVVDDEVAWVGSANLETRAFTRVGEVGVVLDDAPSVSRLTRLFARMWLAGCKYELPAFGDGYRVAERNDFPPVGFTVPAPAVDGRAAVVWTDDLYPADPPGAVDLRRASLHLSLREVIGRARSRLMLASFNLNRMAEHPDLVLEHVADAIDRGVQVELLVRAHNDRDRHRRDAGLFHELGVSVLADDSNHAKAAVADDSLGVLFSANFDADNGLIAGTGVEVGARLDGTAALADLARYLTHALTCASRSYVPRPTARQLNSGLTAAIPPWPLEPEVDIQCDRQEWQGFSDAVGQGPVAWSRRKSEPVELVAGDQRLILLPRGSVYHLQPDATASRHSGDALTQIVRDAHHKDHRNQQHGICTALFRRTVSKS